MSFIKIMISNIFLKRCVVALYVVAAFLAISSPVSATLEGQWIHHTAFSPYSTNKESQIHKIIDGNKYVYFCVRGGQYDQNIEWYYTSMYKTDLLQIFRYDKSKEWSAVNIEPLGSFSTEKKAFPDVIEYSPRLGVLVIVYDNNTIDLIHDDGRVVSTNALKDITHAAATTTPYSATFDPETPTMYLGASFGYVQIDVNTGEIVKGVKLDKKVAWAARMGSDMVVFAGNAVERKTYATTAYRFPAAIPPKSLEGYEIKLKEAIPSITMGSGNTLANLQALMPLTDNTFAAIAPSTSDTYFYLIAVTLGEDANRGELLSARETMDNNAIDKYRHRVRTEGFWQETKDGYRVTGQTNNYVIKRGISFDYTQTDALDKFKSKAIRQIPKTNFTTSEKAVKSGSIDEKRVWTYAYDTKNSSTVVARGFYYLDLDENSQWGEKSELVLPNASHAAIVADIEWNPKYGMLFRGPGCKFHHEAPDGDDLLCSYKDGIWTNRSYSANNPAKADLAQGMTYISSDPLNPDWIWGKYTQGGLLRMDLGDYSNVLMYGRTNHSANLKIPGYFGIYPGYEWNKGTVNFSNTAFDEEGNMWYIFDRRGFGSDFDSEEIRNTYVALLYLTPEQRESMSHVTSIDQVVVPGEHLRIPGVNNYTKATILPLSHPGNKNLVVQSSGHYLQTGDKGACRIYDHNGTLEDTSDDRYVIVKDLRDEDGLKLPYDYEIGIYEDPLSGELWLNTQRGPMIMDPQAILNGSKTFRRLKITSQEGSGGEDVLFDNVEIQQIIHDRAGRKWIATLCDGVFCLSPDTKTVLAHFNSGNSPLPSDYVISVGCDKETGAIFLGTDKGLVEFHPSDIASTAVPAGQHLSIWPSYVTPDYNGYVNISGAVNGMEYEVSDLEGNVICSLGEADGSRMQWDATDGKGNRLPAGRYNIHRKGMDETHRVIIH